MKGDRFHPDLRINRLYEVMMWFVLVFLLHIIFRFSGVIVTYVALITSRVHGITTIAF